MALYPGANVPYDRVSMRTSTLALLALTLAPAVATAKPKVQNNPSTTASGGKVGQTCGVKVLPLAVGNTWTYMNVASPTPALPDVARIAPQPPKTFTITVKSIDAKAGDTVVSLEEKVTYDLTKDPKKPVTDIRTINSTITCNAKNKFDISPDSFFFAGEPGGYLGLTFDAFDRKGTSWQLTAGAFGDKEWPEDITAHWTQTPSKDSEAKLNAGKLEIERRTSPSAAETVVTKAGTYQAEKIVIKTTGRITLQNPKSKDLKPAEMPADWLNQMWFADGYGVVQSLNRYAHEYQLVDSQLK